HNLINYLTKRDYVDRVIVKKRERIYQVLLEKVRDLSRDLYEISALPVDEDGLKIKFTELLSRQHDQIIGLLANYRNAYYPGHVILKDGKKQIENILGINDTATFYKKVWEIRGELNSYAVQAKEIK